MHRVDHILLLVGTDSDLIEFRGNDTTGLQPLSVDLIWQAKSASNTEICKIDHSAFRVDK